MAGHRLEVADVLREHADAYLEEYGSVTSSEQRRVLKDITECRTAARGAHKTRCDRCGHEEISYNSCRNRHCPKCQAQARAEWLEARQADLLETPYFHVVFTLPDLLGPLALQNKRHLYGFLFRAASETLLSIGHDPKHLGAELGFLTILHTWGQNLHHHPHLHCVVPGGGIAPDRSRWIPTRDGFLLPVRVLSRLFRKKFLTLLRRAFDKGDLDFYGTLESLGQPHRWKHFLRSLRQIEWVVYAKAPFGGPHHVLKYLARYTHRVAISNERLVSINGGRVAFRWKDYRRGHQQRTMALDALEFIRRFLLHTLPSGFMRVRYYGFLANRFRAEKLALCRKLIGKAQSPQTPPHENLAAHDSDSESEPRGPTCPACKKGRMVFVCGLPPDTPGLHEPLVSVHPFTPFDTS